MIRYLILGAVMALSIVSRAAEVYFEDGFDGGRAAGWTGDGSLEQIVGRGQVLHISQAAPAGANSSTLTIALPVDKFRGCFVLVGVDVQASAISAKPKSWNGVKVMLIIETPGGKVYPQADIGVGDMEWARRSVRALVPGDATAATLVLGLEQVSGDAWFDNVSVSLLKRIVQTPAADPSKPIYRGHDLPRLRGAMVPNTLGQADLVELADKWNANLIRWQLVQSGQSGQSGQKTPSLEAYDAWLDGELAKLDQVLVWAEQHHTKVVVDLHSPPGGEGNAGGYVAATGRIFASPAAQQKFIACWQKMAQRYRGRSVIWGFDLMNEPEDASVVAGCDDWQDLCTKTAKAVHAIDPQRTLIIEPPPGGDPSGFTGFAPLDEPNAVYSFHMYAPHAITHQGVFGPAPGYTYPGDVDTKHWDKAALDSKRR